MKLKQRRDQLQASRADDLHLCFCICRKIDFLITRLRFSAQSFTIKSTLYGLEKLSLQNQIVLHALKLVLNFYRFSQQTSADSATLIISSQATSHALYISDVRIQHTHFYFTVLQF